MLEAMKVPITNVNKLFHIALVCVGLIVWLHRAPPLSSIGSAMKQPLTQSELDFWKHEALQIPWLSPFKDVFHWNAPFAHWFPGRAQCFVCLS